MLPLLQTSKLAPPIAQLVLSAEQTTLAPGEAPRLHAFVENRGRTELRLIEPQDGSDVGRRNPEVRWVAPDAPKRPPMGRCGNVNPLAAGAFFTLKPGARREISLGWTGLSFPRLRVGTNRLALVYRIVAGRGSGGAEDARAEALYAGLTPVTLVSNTLVLTRRAAP